MPTPIVNDSVELASRDNRAINVIRAGAALLVVLGHVRVLFFMDYASVEHSPGLAVAYSITSLGAEAVIVFFVLSGYWVGGGAFAKLRAGKFRWAEYANSRLTRLWLVLLPALVLTVLVDYVGTSMRPGSEIYTNPSEYAAVPGPYEITHSFGSFLGNMFFLQKIHIQEYGFNKPLWSLAYEFWYYLMFPAAVLVFIASGRVLVRLVSLALLVSAGLIAGSQVLILFPAWLIGAAVASQRSRIVGIIIRSKPLWVTTARMVAGGATLGSMVLVRSVSVPAGLGALLIAVPTGVLLALLTVDLRWPRSFDWLLDSGSWLAKSSYSLYATHMPLVVLLCAFLVPYSSERWEFDVVHLLAAACIIVGLLLFGVAFASCTEDRTETVRKWIKVSVLRKKSPLAEHPILLGP